MERGAHASITTAKMMSFRRKTIKRCVVLIILTGTLGALFTLYMNSEPLNFRSNKFKLEMMEYAINSRENKFECHIPVLPLHSPEMLAFLEDELPIQCDDQEAWVVCGADPLKPWLCIIQDSIIDRLGLISCDFVEIIRPDNDFDIERSQRVRSTKEYELHDSDFVSVNCWTDKFSGREYWSGLLTGIRKSQLIDEINFVAAKEMPFNVIMFGFDSLSRNAFMRKLPRTYKYMTTQLHADILQGYNIVGDGTPQALIPLLTGYTEPELPETRRRIFGSDYVNVYPFIFNEYESNGYVTAFNEDLPNVGTFSYRLNGFNLQPTTHYMRPFYLALQREISRHKRLCVGDMERHNVMLDYTTKFMRAYQNRNPQFAFSFHGELSHDSINLVGVADDDVTEWLEKLRWTGLLNRTILIMMADHGNRFAEVRKTLQGKLEERLPFFSFIFPDAFKTKYPTEYAQFKENIKRLTTPFDIHATLIDILYIQNIQNNVPTDRVVNPLKKPNILNGTHEYDKFIAAKTAEKTNRAISLLRPMPKNRSCADAYIEPHWCSCLSLNFVNVSSVLVKRAANAIVNRINAYTNDERSLCSALKVANITWAGKLVPHQPLIKFKQNRDVDGYVADLTSTTTKITKDLYQLQVYVLPGLSIFEASLTYNLITDQFTVNITDISRINMYGNQAKCILEKNPDLRKFCYCR